MRTKLAMSFSVIFASMYALVLTPTIAQCQSDERTLHSGDRVRVWKDGRTQVATLVQASEDEIVYQVAGGSPVSVRPAGITAIEVSEGSHGNADRGALIGAGVGVAFGLFAAAMAAGDEFLSPTAEEVVAAIMVSTAAGAMLGLAIGAAIRTEDWTAIPSPWIAAAHEQDRVVRVSLVVPIGH